MYANRIRPDIVVLIFPSFEPYLLGSSGKRCLTSRTITNKNFNAVRFTNFLNPSGIYSAAFLLSSHFGFAFRAIDDKGFGWQGFDGEQGYLQPIKSDSLLLACAPSAPQLLSAANPHASTGNDDRPHFAWQRLVVDFLGETSIRCGLLYVPAAASVLRLARSSMTTALAASTRSLASGFGTPGVRCLASNRFILNFPPLLRLRVLSKSEVVLQVLVEAVRFVRLQRRPRFY
jgi:hypothetical protein